MSRLKNSKICLEFIYGSEINLPYMMATFLRKETFKSTLWKQRTEFFVVWPGSALSAYE